MLFRALLVAASVAAAAADVTPAAKLELFEGTDAQAYFRVSIGSNIVLRSEGYTSQAGAVNGLGAAVLNGIAEVNYKAERAADGRWFFNLRAQNYRTIAISSDFFPTEAAAEARVRLVAEALRVLLRERQDAYVNVGGVSFVLLESNNGQRHFNLRAASGSKLLFGHGHASEGAARDAIVQVFVEGHAKRLYSKRTNAAGQHFFELVADGRQLAVSNMFATEAARDAALNFAHATLRLLVEEVVASAAGTAAAPSTTTAAPPATTAAAATTAPPAAGCAALEQQLLSLVYTTKDAQGHPAGPRFLFISESDAPVGATVVTPEAPSTLPRTAEEFRKYTASAATPAEAQQGWLFEGFNLYDTAAKEETSPAVAELVSFFERAAETALYRYGSVVIEQFLAARFAGCNKFFVADFVGVET